MSWLLCLLSGCAWRAPLASSQFESVPATAPALAMASPNAGLLVEATAAALPPFAAPQTPAPEPTQEPLAALPAADALSQADSAVLHERATIGPFSLEGDYCGMQLPLLIEPLLELTAPLPPASAANLNQIPEEARPAVEYMLANPQHVGLAAFEIGREAEGFYLNADNALPLASVVKVIHLAAYARAVQNGELDPATLVPLADLERYYLANSDLGAHPRAVAALAAEERVLGQPPAVMLEDVPRMMMEFSSNAATDYLHMLLGQERIEATAVALGLQQQTAPCPFLGQFLLMGRRADGVAPVVDLLADPQRFAREVLAITEQYSSDSLLRSQSGAWTVRENRPSIEAQQLFSERLNAHGSARDYANLMAQIALNNMGPWEESVRVRRYMEWPTHFPDNQQQLAWLGYKGGSLPGVLTVAYYAQPWNTLQPVVVALFFHELPTEVYRDWRRSLPHDELARWILREREAIPLLQSLLH